MMAVMSTTQQAHVLEIYRIAAERANAQLEATRWKIPQFSMN